ncbi:hypothetical protein OCC_04525 [Thermococcus litoralis DSM 5473]|uniref:S-layer protein n=1 Tax=Thermococcus litoralis (strain ATCC 51850 / DSM 5473 / JCM 8560 / NS-C) TaxID=523849 RepID=H3ZPP9_THELN|nr:S-layer protein [Thermococcus litoralis]EHR78093.1 hypothetical protein OCC_04525 [Thermococcus litoralis DSM 5473]
MKVRKIAALAVGAAMVGATLGYASAQSELPGKEFFVKDGMPNVKIVVGSNAAAMDVVSAADVAVALGTLLYTEKEVEAGATAVVVKEDTAPDPEDIPLYSSFVEDSDDEYDEVTAQKYSELPGNRWWNGSFADDDSALSDAYYSAEFDELFSVDADGEHDILELENTDYYSTFFDEYDTDIQPFGDTITGIQLADVESIELGDSESGTYGEDTPFETELELEEAKIVDYLINIKQIGLYKFDEDDEDYLNDDDKTIPPKSVKLIVPEEGLEVYIDFTIEVYDEADTDDFGFESHSYYYDDLSTDDVEDDSFYEGLQEGDAFTLFGEKYEILSINGTEGEIEIGKDWGTEWIKVNQVLEFNGYKIEAVDLSINEERALFRVTTPDGDTELVSVDVGESDEVDDLRIELETVFVGIEGSTIAEISIQTDVGTIEDGDEDFLDGWKVDLIFNDDGDRLLGIKLTNTDDLVGSTINLFDRYVLKYEFESETKENPEDEENYYAARAYIAVDPKEPQYETKEVKIGEELDDYIIDSVKTEKVKTVEVNKIAESITVLDTEVDVNAVDSNLILVGGPVANAITKYLVEQGMFDWENRDGDLNYLEDVFGEYDVLIVAGEDRYATRDAAKELMEYLAGL